MSNLNSLIIFAKVVDTGSFTAAAQQLNMPVSTVSRKIAELERQLNVRLLERSTRRLKLTEIGSDIHAQALIGAEVSENVKEIVSRQQSQVTGTLRLSAPAGVSETLLVPLVQEFQSKYPAVKVQIMVTDRYVDLITEGLDIVFRVSDLRDSSLVSRKLLEFRHRLLATPDYLRTHSVPKQPDDLLEHNLLTFSTLEPTRSWTLHNGQEKQTIRFQPYLLMNDFSGYAAMLLSGVGIGQFPSIVMPELVDDGRLVEVMPNWRFAARNLSLVHLGNHHMPRTVRLFKELTFDLAPKLLKSPAA